MAKEETPKRKTGRNDYYTERIKPRLKEIKEWYSIGLSEDQIYRNLGVGKTTWYKYKGTEPELQEAIKAGVIPIVIKVKSALVKSALGFTYTERRVFIKEGAECEEICEKYSPPNVASCNLLLKNLDKDNWANDPQAMKMRQLELKHKQQIANNNIFLPVEEGAD